MSKILEVTDLKKYFKTPGGMLHAVDGVSFSIEKGETLGVVGESGCGKSTLGRVLVGLHESTSGSVKFNGQEITRLKKRERKDLHRQVQMIFQDPFSSLNPRRCVAEIIAEPIRIYNICPKGPEREKRVREMMDTVGLARRFAYSYPHELDGGCRQRVGIARALAMDPEFIVCDEPVSALDVAIQAQILNLLQDLQEERGLTYLFITHDLSVVRHISNQIAVMYLGCVMETCEAKALFRKPMHPYTKGLLSAIPIPVLKEKRPPILLQGELTSPVEPPACCRFTKRCPYCTEECRSRIPDLEEVEPGHFVACHNVKQINQL